MDKYTKLALAWRASAWDAEYQKDPNPDQWRTIQGSHVHLDGSGHIDIERRFYSATVEILHRMSKQGKVGP